MTLTFDWVIQHIVVKHSLSPTYVSYFVQIAKKIVDGQMDEHIDGWTDDETGFIRSTWSRLNRLGVESTE